MLGVGGWLASVEDQIRPGDAASQIACSHPGLALELGTPQETLQLLGSPKTTQGASNRDLAARVQYIDFLLIPIYVLFFAVAARSHPSFVPIAALAVLTGLFDYLEDYQILQMLLDPPQGAAKYFGEAKWFFFFATIAAESAVAFPRRTLGETARSFALSALLVLAGLTGMVAAILRNLSWIYQTMRVSLVLLLWLALHKAFSRSQDSRGLG